MNWLGGICLCTNYILIFADCEVRSQLLREGGWWKRAISLCVSADGSHDESEVESGEERHGDQLYHGRDHVG